MEKSKVDRGSTTVEDNNDNDDEWINADDMFSDDSSFYGDEETKAEYERRAAAYNPQEYWDIVQWDVQHLKAQGARRLRQRQGTKRKHEDTADPDSPSTTIASKKLIASPVSSTKVLANITHTRPYNPYEGNVSAKQLSEDLNGFLSRLPPSTTSMADIGPWIWVANPCSSYHPIKEDIARFKQEGSRALANYLLQKSALEDKHPAKTPAGITRMLKADRDDLETRIVQLAKDCSVICGKWMLFPPPERVDVVWSTVAKAVINNELGCSAKAATNDGDPNEKQRLICVYTVDFSDIQDVKRVLSKMRGLGLLSDNKGRHLPIYYKCDAYTHLDITSGNEYKLKASMYSSKDLISEMNT